MTLRWQYGGGGRDRTEINPAVQQLISVANKFILIQRKY